MEDKRIAKTKQNLKHALVDLAAEKPFEQITVTELCKRASTSRITFYAHYSDKYELLDEVFRDMRASASQLFHRMQRENNPQGDEIVGCCNLLDAILNVYYGQEPLFAHAVPHESSYLFYYLHNYIIENVAGVVKRYRPGADERKVKQMVAFVCSGLWVMILQGQQAGQTLEESRNQAQKMLRALLTSGALAKGFE